jgi:prolyl 4-hydroxylase
MTVTVLSCAPRVYEVTNFLSDAEVDHIISLAKAIELKPSSTGQGTDHGSEKKTKTRTSLNTWVGRETDQVIDAIYRRSADFLRIDEALFRDRDADEFPDLRPKGPISEQLQLVHYNVGQEYTAHHDFGYAAAGDKVQGARYATLLFYLNEPEQGGETEFPRWFNGETARGLTTSPKKGKAVLFYSQLPDGNMDDLSHHAALPVREGEKFLMNLWVRDPSFGST